MKIKLWGTKKDQYFQLISEGREWNLTNFPSLSRDVLCRAATNVHTFFKIDKVPVTGYEEGSYWVNAEILSDEEANKLMQDIIKLDGNCS